MKLSFQVNGTDSHGFKRTALSSGHDVLSYAKDLDEKGEFYVSSIVVCTYGKGKRGKGKVLAVWYRDPGLCYF